MKRSEKLLDAIGQIDDKLVTEAAQAGRTPGSRTKNRKKKKKMAKMYRWQGALAACAVLAVCVGVIGLLNRSGMLLGPLSSGSSGAEEMALDASAQDAAAGSADISAQSAEAVPEAAAESHEVTAESPEVISRQSSAPDMAEAALEEGNADQEMKEAGQNVQSSGITASDSATDEEDSGISAQSSSQTEELAAAAGPVAFTIRESDEKSVTFLIRNDGEQEIHFGEMFELERFVNDSWEKVIPEKEPVWNEAEISVGTGDTYEGTIVLDSCYGTLQPGRYRIVKTCQLADGEEPEGQETYPMYAEFTIGQ